MSSFSLANIQNNVLLFGPFDTEYSNFLSITSFYCWIQYKRAYENEVFAEQPIKEKAVLLVYAFS